MENTCMSAREKAQLICIDLTYFNEVDVGIFGQNGNAKQGKNVG